MSFKCKLGLHSWNGCKCTECGKERDQLHDWSKDCEKCSICGKIEKNIVIGNICRTCGNKIGKTYREPFKPYCYTCKKIVYSYHTFKNDCEVCSTCGKLSGNNHNWSKDCEKCSNCGKIRVNEHDWDGCKCKTCGKTRDEQHVWNGCICTICGHSRNEEHNWKGCVCTKCKKTRDEQHDWDGCKCKKCGKTKNEHHLWENDKCIRCGVYKNSDLGQIMKTLDESFDAMEFFNKMIYYGYKSDFPPLGGVSLTKGDYGEGRINILFFGIDPKKIDYLVVSSWGSKEIILIKDRKKLY